MNNVILRNKPNPATERGSLFEGPMRLAELVYGAWAMLPDHVRELQAIYETHLRGDKIDVKAIEANLGRPLSSTHRPYDVVNGVAIVRAQGVISPKANLMTQVSGGTSAQMFVRELQAARQDPGVRGAVAYIDSPGGSVLGIPAALQAMRDFAEEKALVTFSDGNLCSAAYWFGSGANAIYQSGATDQAGSLGVVFTHSDTSASDAKAGVKKTDITAGKYKRIASSNAPLTEEGRASLQDQCDYLYTILCNDVAANRGVAVDTVLEHMAEGRVFIGQQAIDVGLVDGVSTLDALIEAMATDPGQFAKRRKAKVKPVVVPKSASAGAASEDVPTDGDSAVDPSTTSEGNVMAGADTTTPITREVLERDHAALFAQVRSEFTALGATQERDRIKGVRGTALPGHEALVEQLAMDGKTTPAEAALAVNAAQRSAIAAAAAAHAGDAPNAAPSSVAGGDKAKTKEQQLADAQAYATEHKVDLTAALKAVGVR